MPPTSIPHLHLPLSGPFTQYFGENPADYAPYGYPGHNGLDIGGQGEVSACDQAIVEKVTEEIAGYGLCAVLKHKWGVSYYAHLKKGSVTIRPGFTVEPGKPFAISNNTGNSKGNHLHFAIRLFDRSGPWKGYVDPLPYLQQQIEPSVKSVQSVVDLAIFAPLQEKVLTAQVISPDGLLIRLNPEYIAGGGYVGHIPTGSQVNLLDLIQTDQDDQIEYQALIAWIAKSQKGEQFISIK